MDFQYFLFLFYVVLALALAGSLYMLGKTSAERVWERAKKELDADPTLLVVSVPYVTSVEAILIFAAVMLRSPAQLVKVAYRECRLQAWERKPAIRQFDAAMREHNDVLGAVSSIISGYPERARYFLDAQRGMAHARHFQAYMDDYQVIHGNTEGVQTS